MTKFTRAKAKRYFLLVVVYEEIFQFVLHMSLLSQSTCVRVSDAIRASKTSSGRPRQLQWLRFGESIVDADILFTWMWSEWPDSLHDHSSGYDPRFCRGILLELPKSISCICQTLSRSISRSEREKRERDDVHREISESPVGPNEDAGTLDSLRALDAGAGSSRDQSHCVPDKNSCRWAEDSPGKGRIRERRRWNRGGFQRYNSYSEHDTHRRSYGRGFWRVQGQTRTLNAHRLVRDRGHVRRSSLCGAYAQISSALSSFCGHLLAGPSAWKSSVVSTTQHSIRSDGMKCQGRLLMFPVLHRILQMNGGFRCTISSPQHVPSPFACCTRQLCSTRTGVTAIQPRAIPI